jgi:hypothetical protein
MLKEIKTSASLKFIRDLGKLYLYLFSPLLPSEHTHNQTAWPLTGLIQTMYL